MSFSPVKKSAFYHRQLAIGAQMVERDGWLQPAFYTSADQEERKLTKGIGISDISPVGKLLIQGGDLGGSLHGVLDSDDSPAIGDVRQVSDPARGRLARLTADECLVLFEPEALSDWTTVLGEPTRDCAHIVDQTSGLCGVRLIGPGSGALLSKLTEFDTSPGAFTNMRCAQSRFAEIHGTIVRADLDTLPSYDLFFSREFGEYVWDAIFEAGEEFGVAPVGLEAMDRLTVDPAVTLT